MGHDHTAAGRIILGTLANVIHVGLPPAQAARNLRGHARYCRAAGDEGTADVAEGCAHELEAGSLPTVVDLPGLARFTTDGKLPEAPEDPQEGQEAPEGPQDSQVPPEDGHEAT